MSRSGDALAFVREFETEDALDVDGEKDKDRGDDADTEQVSRFRFRRPEISNVRSLMKSVFPIILLAR
jgi:hypothetical protein